MIKRIHQRDEAIQQFVDAAFNELRAIYKPNEKAIASRSENQKDQWELWGYFEGSQCIGYVETRLDNHDLQFRTLAVHHLSRRKGIARQLLAAVQRAYPSSKTASLWCVAETGNPAIFEAMGFRTCQRFSSEILVLPSGEPTTEVQMRRAT